LQKTGKPISTKRLEGMVALITGASSGIGAAVAKAYASEGAKVAINHFNEKEQAESVVRNIRGNGGNAIAIEADITSSADVEKMADIVHEVFGPIGILVNNAGIYPRDDWKDLTEEKWDRVIEINMKGCYICSKAAYRDMCKTGYGKIINVSSIAALSGSHLVHYGTSKAGIIGFTRGLALSLGKYNICVNAILPGAIKVEREIELDDYKTRLETDKIAVECQCIKRRGTPEDTVGAFIFFASHESDWITGHCLCVDGGWKKY